MNFEEKKILTSSYFYGQLQLLSFSLDTIQCKFTQKKIENLQKRALHFLCND